MYDVGLEAWSDALWDEVRDLAEAHNHEVDDGVEPRRPFRLDRRLMAMMRDSGSLVIVIARQAGRPVGYFTWSVEPDVESEGLVIAQQGAWYVAPGHPRAAYLMFHESVAALKALGVQCIFPHHRTQGRGRALGRFFARLGAKEIQHTYSLWIGI